MTVAIRSARNFSVQMAGFAVTLVDRFLFTGLLIRAWGVESFSDWSVLIAATSLIAIADLGFQIYLGNMLSRAKARGLGRAFNQIVGLGIAFYACIALLVMTCIAGILLLFDVADLFNTHNRDLGAVFTLLAAQQTLRTVRNAVAQVYRGMGEMHRLLWLDVRATGIGILLGSAAVFLGAQPLTVAMIFLGSEIIFGTGWVIVQVRSRYDWVRLSVRKPSLLRMKDTARALQWYSLFQMLSYLLSNMPVLIIGWLGQAGPLLVTFVVQRTMVNMGRVIGNTLSQGAGVELAAEADARGGAAPLAGVLILARINGALAGLMTAGLLLFGRDVVWVWTGQRELGSLAILIWLLLPAAIVAPAVPLQMLSVFGHRLRPQAIAASAQAAIAVPGAIVAGAHFGTVGVAAALAIGEIVGMGIIAPLLTARPLGIRYWVLVRSTAAIWLLTVTWSGLVGLVIDAAVSGSSAWLVIIKLLLWGGFGGLPVAWLTLPNEIRERVLNFALSRMYGRRST